MRQIKGKDGTVRECHMSAGKGMRLNQKFGRSIFSISSEEGLMQIAGLDPAGGYELFMELLGLTIDELDNFEVDDIWVFLEGIFTDFFPPRMREKIPKILEALKTTVLNKIEEQFASMDTPIAASNSATGSVA
jgi:hypothetical protein